MEVTLCVSSNLHQQSFLKLYIVVGFRRLACRSFWQWLVVLSMLQVEFNIKKAKRHSIVVKSSADKKVVYMINN